MRNPRLLFAAAIVALSSFVCSGHAQTKSAGLSLAFSDANKASDVTTVPNVSLYVSAGQSPTPFLPGGKFTAVFSGLVTVDLRGDYAFDADLNGELKLEINGQTILDVSGTGGSIEASKPVRLGKGGTNTITATFTSPAQGDAFIRLRWKPRDSFFQPIPNTALNHALSADEEKASALRLGRTLFIEHRCAACHTTDKSDKSIPDLVKDAPSFENIGARRNYDWMARWIQDPKALRPTAHMPKIFSGDNAKENASAVASYLVSLKSADAPTTANAGKAAAGKKLFDTLHCVACHNAPDGSEVDPKKLSLKQVVAKFAPGSITEFLKDPSAHYAWIQMPRFKLSDEQRADLAAYLIASADKANETAAPTEKAILDKGKQLVETSGCLNCHGLKTENKFAAKSLANLTDWKKGCLAEKPEAGSKAPQFEFSAEQREALRSFAATDRMSLQRHVLTDFAERYSSSLNCRNCHGSLEGVPRFDVLGGKLKPEWSAKFIAGDVSYKPRPWLESQMPAFPHFAQDLAKGMALLSGYPAQTPAESDADKETVQTGHNLVSNPPHGFACISCHSVGSFGATQVFEAPGINLARTGERLLPQYFKRWLRNPPLIDPQTKMPVYFDEEGKSPYTEVYGGDGEKQIAAIWQYIRLGEKMPAPKTE